MWFLGVARGPSPSSHPRHPLDPLLWRSARELICSFSPTLLTRIFLGSSVFASIFPFIIPFSHLTFIQLLSSVVQAFCTSAVLFCLCKVPLQYVIWILPLNRRLQIWPPLLQLRGNFGSVPTALRVCLLFLMTTILYALDAEIRYVTWSLFVRNAATGLLRNAGCLLTITIVSVLNASTNNVRLG